MQGLSILHRDVHAAGYVHTPARPCLSPLPCSSSACARLRLQGRTARPTCSGPRPGTPPRLHRDATSAGECGRGSTGSPPSTGAWQACRRLVSETLHGSRALTLRWLASAFGWPVQGPFAVVGLQHLLQQWQPRPMERHGGAREPLGQVRGIKKSVSATMYLLPTALWPWLFLACHGRCLLPAASWRW